MSETIFDGPISDKKRVFEIKHFHFNAQTKEIMFMKFPVTENLAVSKFNIQRLKISSGFKLLEGFEDEQIEVTYKKIE